MCLLFFDMMVERTGSGEGWSEGDGSYNTESEAEGIGVNTQKLMRPGESDGEAEVWSRNERQTEGKSKTGPGCETGLEFEDEDWGESEDEEHGDWVLDLDMNLEPALGHWTFIFDLDLSKFLQFTRPASGRDRRKLTDYSLL